MKQVISIFLFLLFISCEKIFEDDNSRVESITVGISEIKNTSAIISGKISVEGDLPDGYNIVGRGIIYGKNNAGLELKSCNQVVGDDGWSKYNEYYGCFQYYAYSTVGVNVYVQSYEISSVLEKDDGSVDSYEFRQGGGIGTYDCLIQGLDSGTTYYARSFACIENTQGRTYNFLYGDIIEFNTLGITLDPTTFIEVSALGLGIMKSDIGTTGGGLEAERLCSHINFYDGIGGYHDWRIPTLSELEDIYKLRDQIGGFKGEKYWSSTVYGESPYYYFWDFSNNTSGHQSSALDGGKFSINANVRLVRTIKR